MTQAIPFAKLLGAKARSRREELELTQDELARRCWTVGFPFTRSVIDAIERGTRDLNLPEVAALFAVLDLSLDDLRGAGRVALDRGISIDVTTFVGQLAGERKTWNVQMGDLSANVRPWKGTVTAYSESTVDFRRLVGAYSDAEIKAARRLGTTPDAIATAAEKLWKHSLDAERDQRVMEQASPDASARTIQALRGHVTRTLLEKLRPRVRPRRPKERST